MTPIWILVLFTMVATAAYTIIAIIRSQASIAGYHRKVQKTYEEYGLSMVEASIPARQQAKTMLDQDIQNHWNDTRIALFRWIIGGILTFITAMVAAAIIYPALGMELPSSDDHQAAGGPIPFDVWVTQPQMEFIGKYYDDELLEELPGAPPWQDLNPRDRMEIARVVAESLSWQIPYPDRITTRETANRFRQMDTYTIAHRVKYFLPEPPAQPLRR